MFFDEERDLEIHDLEASLQTIFILLLIAIICFLLGYYITSKLKELPCV